ncbi:MAG TPA: tRNA preQ1(34) S-adenosylmethionine ribosyltransferase-isomerase QueA [Pyrinomonadaceae bacterium]|nr:tRNA preQ1(34) S-adenosylmethionine ribosyltransferase-isomerase QueA [Pyrinomonadaceae bacterium]
MLISDFDYELPEELIAQEPLAERDASRMLVLDRARGAWRDGSFAGLPAELREGDHLVVNNTRVFPARLVGRREPSGGQVELFLIEPRGERLWEALARPARRLPRGQQISFGNGRLRAEILDAGDEGRRTVRFDCAGDFDALLEEFGRVPLPPYIKRADKPEAPDARLAGEDRERYQTIYAEHRGAIAAPTAGLHFTPRTMESLSARGVSVTEITLHVGYGTFAPVRASDLSAHAVAAERYEITPQAAASLDEARARGQRIVAVGTTTVRALESAADERTLRVTPGARSTALTITPGYKFKVVNALVTNFHLPRSSLLVLIASFAGRELTLAAYRHAVAARYRFYSYGDCMLIF